MQPPAAVARLLLHRQRRRRLGRQVRGDPRPAGPALQRLGVAAQRLLAHGGRRRRADGPVRRRPHARGANNNNVNNMLIIYNITVRRRPHARGVIYYA